jgi:hypothetical protein
VDGERCEDDRTKATSGVEISKEAKSMAYVILSPVTRTKNLGPLACMNFTRFLLNMIELGSRRC